MLEGDMVEASTGRIYLPGKSKKEFRLVLPWITGSDGRPNIQKHMKTLLRWADEYEIEALRLACERRLRKTPVHSVKDLKLALQFNLSERMNQCMEALLNDLPEHIGSLRDFASNPTVAPLLWPALFRTMGLDAP